MNKYIMMIFCMLSLLIISCSSAVRFSNSDLAPKNVKVGDTFKGKASYYSDLFHSQVTASGDYYDMEKFTAAHRSFPFGTMVRIRSLRNNREVVVRINDRGPFKEERIIDISKVAAEKLDMIGQGVQDVEIIIIELPK